MGEPWEEQTRK